MAGNGIFDQSGPASPGNGIFDQPGPSSSGNGVFDAPSGPPHIASVNDLNPQQQQKFYQGVQATPQYTPNVQAENAQRGVLASNVISALKPGATAMSWMQRTLAPTVAGFSPTAAQNMLQSANQLETVQGSEGQGVGRTLARLPGQLAGAAVKYANPFVAAGLGAKEAYTQDQQAKAQGQQIDTGAEVAHVAGSAALDAIVGKMFGGTAGGPGSMIEQKLSGYIARVAPQYIAKYGAKAAVGAMINDGAMIAQQALNQQTTQPGTQIGQGLGANTLIGAGIPLIHTAAHDIFGPKTAGSPAETPGARPPAASPEVKQAETPVAPTPAREPVAQTTNGKTPEENLQRSNLAQDIKQINARLQTGSQPTPEENLLDAMKRQMAEQNPPPDLEKEGFGQGIRENTRNQPVTPEGRAEAKRVWDSTQGKFVAEQRTTAQPVPEERRLNVEELPHKFQSPKELFSRNEQDEDDKQADLALKQKGGTPVSESSLHPAQREILDIGEHLRGERPTPYRGGDTWGLHASGKNFVNMDQPVSEAMNTVGHEAFHGWQDTHSKEAESFWNAVPEDMKNQLADRYKIPASELAGEGPAHLFGEYFSDPAFRKQIIEANPTGLKAAMQWVGSKLGGLTTEGKLKNQAVALAREASSFLRSQSAAPTEGAKPTLADQARSFLKNEEGGYPIKLPSKAEVTGPGSIFHEEIKPRAAAAGQTMKDVADLVKQTFPVETKAANPETTKLFRSNINARANEQASAARKMQSAVEAVDKLGPNEKLEAMAHVYNDSSHPDPTIRKIQDAVYDDAKARKEQFAERGHEGAQQLWKDHWYNMQWEKDPEKASKMLSMVNQPGRLTTAKSLKGRVLSDFWEGIEKGLVPKDQNFVRMTLAAGAEQRRFLASYDALHGMHEAGTLQVTRDHPAGMTDITRVLTPEMRKMLLKGEEDDKGWNFYTDDPSAKIIRNIVTPSAVAGNPIFETLRSAKNFASQILLGWSGVHMGNTVFNSIASDMTAALPRSFGGEGDVSKILHAPGGLVTDIGKGKAVQERMLNIKNSAGLDQEVIDHMKKATQAEVHADYQTNFRRKFQEAIGGLGETFREGKQVLGIQKVIRALGYAPFAANEKVMSDGIFSYVNHVKLAHMYEGLAKWRGEHPNAGPDEMQSEANRLSDHVDDVFGQMNHDNLMWNRTGRDLLQLGMLSTTWNFGTGRLLWNTATSKKGMAALMGMAATHAMYGVMKTYLNTGQGPQSLKDYIFPPTGDKDKNGTALRERPPGYMADIYEFLHHPGDSLFGKTGPIGTWAQEALGNQFHDGGEILSSKNSFAENLANLAKAVMEPAHPAVAQQLQRALERNEGTPFDKTIGVAGSLFERRAPMEYNRSPAQNKAIQLRRQIEEAPDELTHSRVVSGFADDLRAGRAGTRDKINAAAEQGSLDEDDKEAIVKLSEKPTGLEGTLLSHGLTAKDVMAVWDQMSDAEKKETEAVVRHKIRQSKKLTTEERTHYFDQINRDMKD